MDSNRNDSTDDRPIEDVLTELAAEVPDEDWNRLAAAEAHRVAKRILLAAEAERYPKPRRRWSEWMWRLLRRGA